jgi:mRNA interferase MazF
MKTVQMTLDESLVEEVDRAAEALGTTRSAFTREALREALVRRRELELERRHRAGYAAACRPRRVRRLERPAGLARLMQPSEIRWYRFGAPDKRRPVLVLTRDSALDFLGEATVAPITSTIRDIPAEVLLTEANGMPRASAINLDHLQTVPQDRLEGVITTLASDRMAEVRAALLFALGFPIER